ncbi:MAG: hypothetical protein JO253_04635 [Alphaproteobacteria bacterium]|nr:hypothetical protein [Alphaproteobacteria bacterium]
MNNKIETFRDIIEDLRNCSAYAKECGDMTQAKDDEALAYRLDAALAAQSQGYGKAVLWVESEKSAIGNSLKSIINGMFHTVKFHTKEPQTSNPVWPLFTAQPAQQAVDLSDEQIDAIFAQHHNPHDDHIDVYGFARALFSASGKG